MEQRVTPYEAIGGKEVVCAVVEAFYDQMEQHEPELAALHELDDAGKVSRAARDRFALFLCFWLGGPDDYLRAHGHPRLRMRHARVPIGEALRDAWLRSMTRALEQENILGPARDFLDGRFAEVADFLRNRPN